MGGIKVGETAKKPIWNINIYLSTGGALQCNPKLEGNLQSKEEIEEFLDKHGFIDIVHRSIFNGHIKIIRVNAFEIHSILEL